MGQIDERYQKEQNMTFFKQMVLLMSTFILLILVSIMVLNFSAATHQVQNQLYSNAQDTVSSLSLSLSTVQGETSAIETMINAVYDSGNYKRVILRDNAGKEIYSRVTEFADDETPQWFKELFTLTAPPAFAQVSSGWMPIGILEVTSLESDAYSSLYNTFRYIIRSFLIISLITFTLLYLLLNIILKSLKEVKKQADAISKNEFFTNDNIPFTTEFKDVTIAMNTMVNKVKDIFTKEVETLKRYHELIYKDEISGLSNRRFLILRLNELLKSNTAESNGVIFFISIDKLLEANNEIGHNKVDELLLAFADILNQEARPFEESICTRINGSDFAVLLPSADIHRSEQSANSICHLAQELFIASKAENLELYLSMVQYDEADGISTIFSKADYGLSKCKLQEPFSVYINSEESRLSLLGKQEFSHIILNAMQENRLTMALQPVLNTETNIVLHEEAYLRLIGSQGEVFSAGYFMPMIYALNLQVDVDKYMIKHIIAQDEFRASPMAINITLDFIKDSANIQWLNNLLSQSTLRHPLYFEISNSAVMDNIEATVYFSKTIKTLGHFFGIDRFVISESGLNYLQKITPDYIKIDQAYLHDLASADNEAYNNVLGNIIKTLDIKLISTSVETEEEKTWLEQHQYHCMQGNLILDTELIEIL